MDTRELLTFVTMCETLNYKRAADKLQYVPSTLFKHIQQLESEMGTALFARNGRNLTVTPAGERFLPHATRMLQEYHEAMGINQIVESAIKIGGCEMNTSNALIRFFKRFSGAYPEIRLNMVSGPNSSVPDLVRTEKADAGFFYSRGGPHKDIRVIHLYREQAFPVACSKNKLYRKKDLRYEDLEGMEFIYTHDSCCFASMLMQELSKRGVRLKKETYLGSLQLAMENINQPNTFTLIPYQALERSEKLFDLHPLDMQEDPICAWQSLLLGKKTVSKTVNTLIDFTLADTKLYGSDIEDAIQYRTGKQ